MTLHALDDPAIRSLRDTGRARVDGVEIGWDDADRHNLDHRVHALDADPGSAPYLVHVLLDGPLVAARIGCHDAPRDGEVEIGYFVAPHYRGRGVATAMVTEFLEWLHRQGVRRVVATIEPGNDPSLSLVLRLGFVPAGELVEDDGQRMLCFVRELEALA
ncbi:MAG: GNAT family N-acetyltransferase [Nocardioidaceae bacterium]|nr:GNAT family N-acetyltransferase [Nocardioidaceae bacterium]NUS50961.1 GNAT family N-acetyltransferase [Nocardioidaceae bacterium]